MMLAGIITPLTMPIMPICMPGPQICNVHHHPLKREPLLPSHYNNGMLQPYTRHLMIGWLCLKVRHPRRQLGSVAACKAKSLVEVSALAPLVISVANSSLLNNHRS